jgi:hypothetical protein
MPRLFPSCVLRGRENNKHASKWGTTRAGFCLTPASAPILGVGVRAAAFALRGWSPRAGVATSAHAREGGPPPPTCALTGIYQRKITSRLSFIQPLFFSERFCSLRFLYFFCLAWRYTYRLKGKDFNRNGAYCEGEINPNLTPLKPGWMRSRSRDLVAHRK